MHSLGEGSTTSAGGDDGAPSLDPAAGDAAAELPRWSFVEMHLAVAATWGMPTRLSAPDPFNVEDARPSVPSALDSNDASVNASDAAVANRPDAPATDTPVPIGSSIPAAETAAVGGPVAAMETETRTETQTETEETEEDLERALHALEARMSTIQSDIGTVQT